MIPVGCWKSKAGASAEGNELHTRVTILTSESQASQATGGDLTLRGGSHLLRQGKGERSEAKGMALFPCTFYLIPLT